MSEPGQDGERKAAILTEILELTQVPKRQPGDITAQDYTDADGCSETTAVRRMNELVEVGTHVTAMVYDTEIRHLVRVWRKVEGVT